MKRNENLKLDQFPQKHQKEKLKQNKTKRNETSKLDQFPQKAQKEKPNRTKMK